MDRGKVEIVLVASGSVGTQDQAMDGVVLVCWTAVRATISAFGSAHKGHSVRLLVWKPLDSQTWPVERVGNDQVIEEGRVLLPYLLRVRACD
jgi:hypothetical protein